MEPIKSSGLSGTRTSDPYKYIKGDVELLDIVSQVNKIVEITYNINRFLKQNHVYLFMYRHCSATFDWIHIAYKIRILTFYYSDKRFLEDLFRETLHQRFHTAATLNLMLHC